MAPRGRPRKNNTRMDGAIEAMTKEYGFTDKDLVKKVVKELLQEYGGEDGWFFIEQYSYKELLEALLRYQEETDQEKPDNKRDDLPENCSLEEEKADGHTLTDVVGPSGVLEEAICSELVVKNGLEISSQDDINRLPPTNKNEKSWKDIGLDEGSSQIDKSDGNCDKDEKANSNEDQAKISILLAPPPLAKISSPPPPSPPVTTVGSKRRQPCYGWIESDDEEYGDDDFIYLTSAVVGWESLNSVSDKRAKRRSRWDVRPEDP